MPDRWRLIEDLYHRAVALPADERAAFLDNACRADSELRAEIDSLLAEGSGPASFMRLPAIEHTARDLAVAEPLVTGQQFGPFKILEPAGKGAMGEVYRARDLKLGRDVAIKVLPPSFVLDAGRVARFDLEARVLAALNHPNIATIHGVEEFDDRKLLVLEFVEGITLAERLTTGALPVREAVDLAIQIADALESAHEHGIVHRDLKPANIKVRPDGKVKVLDFGLAKQSVSFAAQGVTQSLEPQATHQGTIVGTAGYMAPEQATGQPVDRRADIWAFGVVLYEMVTGTAPFSGKTTSEILSRVIAQDPDLGALPQSVRALVEKCLRKDPRTRWQWIGDVRLLLEEGSSGAVLDVQHSLPAHALSRRTLAITATVCAVALAVVAALYVGLDELPIPTTRFTVPIPGDAPEDASFVVSPDGRALAITSMQDGQRRLWVRSLDALEARLLPGTDRAQLPFWSPDSTQIGFFADRRLKRMPVSGGFPSIIAEIGADFQGASWNDNGIIVFSLDGLKRVNSAGGSITRLATGDDLESTFYPRFLPGGQHLFFRANRPKETESGIFVGALNGAPVQQISRDYSNAAYLSSPGERDLGWILFRRADALMAQRFDARELRVAADAFIVAEGIAGGVGRAEFSVSDKGDLAYRLATLFQLTWVDRAGATLEEVGPPSTDWSPANEFTRLSPDETKLAYSRLHAEDGGRNREVWQLDLVRNVPERVTFAPSPELNPVWSPDSSQLAFTSNRNSGTGFDTYLMSAQGEERLLVAMPGEGWPLDWSAAGVLQLQGDRVWIVPTDGTPPRPYGQFSTRVARFDPTGRWVAYVADESGQNDIYVRPFPGPGRAVQVSAGGGAQPQWRQDGSELFYVAGDGTLTAVPVQKSATTIQFGRPARLFPSAAGYQASADGQRFLVARPTDPAGPSITVVLNWTGTLER